jgi:hypothetical protein
MLPSEKESLFVEHEPTGGEVRCQTTSIRILSSDLRDSQCERFEVLSLWRERESRIVPDICPNQLPFEVRCSGQACIIRHFERRTKYLERGALSVMLTGLSSARLVALLLS